MISVHPTTVNKLLEIKIQGDLTEEDIGEFSALLILKTNAEDKVDFLIDFDEWKGTSCREFITCFKLEDHSEELNKLALVANSNWIKIDADLDNLLPHVELMQFQPDEKHIAEAWLSV